MKSATRGSIIRRPLISIGRDLRTRSGINPLHALSIDYPDVYTPETLAPLSRQLDCTPRGRARLWENASTRLALT